MALLIIRHKISDYTNWKKAYDNHTAARTAGGLGKGRVTRSVDEPNEIVLLFEVADIKKAKAFCASEDLKAAMQGAGVVDKPDLFFLDDAS
jgi:hypothetical protein